MLSKRRPTTSAKSSSKSKLEPSSLLSHRRTPIPHDLIGKKYYLPVVQEEEKHRAFQITRFIAGFRTSDELGLGQLQKLYIEFQWMAKYQNQASYELQGTINDYFNRDDGSVLQFNRFPMHFHGFAYYMVLENQRKTKKLVSKRSFAKKESQRSTDYSSKKEINILGTFSNILKEKQQLNQSHELSKLTKCLRNVLKKHDKVTSYKGFLQDMEKRMAKDSQKSQGYMQLIINLEKDFSSIHQQLPNAGDFSKESIYGLSDLKKKSDKNQSKIELNSNKPKDKGKRLSANFALCKMDFVRRLQNVEKSGKGTSNSKNSRKSNSVRSRKGNINVPTTPDNHHSSNSKSSSKKTLTKLASDKKSKLTDTQRLYFDEGFEKNEEKKDTKNSLLREGGKKSEAQSVKSKKRLLVKR